MRVFFQCLSRGLLILFGLGGMSLPLMASGVSDSVDEIRIETIHSSNGHIQVTKAAQILKEGEAQKMAHLWNSLKFESIEKDCLPHPAFRLSFYKKGTLESSALVCFECHIIILKNSAISNDLNGSEGVFADDESAAKLQQFLVELVRS